MSRFNLLRILSLSVVVLALSMVPQNAFAAGAHGGGGGGGFHGGGGGGGFHGGGGGGYHGGGGYGGGSHANYAGGYRGGYYGYRGGYGYGYRGGYGYGYRGGWGYGWRGGYWGYPGWGWGWGGIGIGFNFSWGYPYYSYGYPYYYPYPYYPYSYYPYSPSYQYGPVSAQPAYSSPDPYGQANGTYPQPNGSYDQPNGSYQNYQPNGGYQNYGSAQPPSASAPAPNSGQLALHEAVYYSAPSRGTDPATANYPASSAARELSQTRPEVQNVVRALRAMPPEARQRQLESGRYRNLSPQEMKFVRSAANLPPA
jgi:hypothetical protein